MTAPLLDPSEEVWSELWISLASLLRSYTVAHGLHDNRVATIQLTEERITAHHGKKWLALERSHTTVTWTRENGTRGMMEFTDHGRLRGPNGEEEMDLAAEAWARELMQDHAAEVTR